ncbi:MAG: 16S rRNA (uracil(1498)-N(3))-methyltransferase [Bacteroidota bacterium]
MHLFYTPHISGGTHELDEQESKHAIRVLRLVRGDGVILVDGAGGWYEAAILEDHPKRCLLEIRNHTPGYQPLPYHLHVAISPTKNMDRFEWFLEKATEIGISEITPLMCHRTERKQVKMERMERIVVSAMKQSLKAYKPALSEPVSMVDFLKQEHSGMRGIAHCIPTERLSLAGMKPRGRYTLMIGPEGDFTDQEVQLAVDAGFSPVHLGASRLRTETAGVHICSAIQIIECKLFSFGT